MTSKDNGNGNSKDNGNGNSKDNGNSNSKDNGNGNSKDNGNGNGRSRFPSGMTKKLQALSMIAVKQRNCGRDAPAEGSARGASP